MSSVIEETFIKQGEDLVDEAEKDIKDKGTECAVSPSMPMLVIWLAKLKLAKLKDGGNGSGSEISFGKLKIKGRDAIIYSMGALICIAVFAPHAVNLIQKLQKLVAVETPTELVSKK